jgi:hypothetical protein
MRMKKPRIARLDEVLITRGLEEAVIEYLEPNIATTHLTIGPEVQQMSDQEILDLFNDTLRAQEELAASFEHVAVEIPPGKPQIRYFPASDQWTPRGSVLRCEIDDGGPDGEPVIAIDDQELSWREFGRLIVTHAGWGMRIIFVPDDRIGEQPEIQIREPRENNRDPAAN